MTDPSGSAPSQLGGRSPVGEAGQPAPEDAGSGVRERLIEAVGMAMHDGFFTTEGSGLMGAELWRYAAERALAGVVGLIADEIEREGREVVGFFAGDKTQVGLGRLVGAEDAYRDAIRLVRSWAADGAR